MAKAISDYSELLAEIAKLPKPPAGTVRVFRGQTGDYPRLDPSGLRHSPRLEAIWRVYSRQLYYGLTHELRQNASVVSKEDLQAQLWFSALAQQYGPGSAFLDVTYSLDIALWFALNKTSMVDSGGPIGHAGPIDPVRDHESYAQLVRYDPWREIGWLYVFDLPLWNGEGMPRAAEVVDLAKAPEIFSSSPRMRAQLGCLIYCCNEDKTAIDVRKFLVGGAPLPVRRPMTGTTALDRRVADIYPSPEQDEWFARFLSVPMTYSPRPAPPKLQRSIPVGVYFDPDDERYVREVLFYDVALPNPLVHRSVPELQGRPSTNELAPTIILLEAPMVFQCAPGDSDQWHHGLLWTDVPDRCDEYDFDAKGPVGEVSLADVFFEFSLLEDIWWEHVVRKKRRIDARRGVWLRRSGETLEVAILLQKIPGAEVETFGFFRLFYDSLLRRIMVSLPASEQGALPINEVEGEFAKRIIVALMLLRHLSPRLKCDPTPADSDGDGETTYRFLLNCSCDAARLYRVPSSPNPDWFVLRDANNPDEPFSHVTRPTGVLRVLSRFPFWDIPLQELRSRLPS